MCVPRLFRHRARVPSFAGPAAAVGLTLADVPFLGDAQLRPFMAPLFHRKRFLRHACLLPTVAAVAPTPAELAALEGGQGKPGAEEARQAPRRPPRLFSSQFASTCSSA